MFGVILSRAVSFIMLPIYTHYLIPGDYGVLELLVMTSEVIAIFIGLGLPSAIFRFYSEKESTAEKNRVISTALISGSALFFVIFGLMFINSRFFSVLLFGSDAYVHHFRVLFASMAFASSLELPLIYLRARAKSVKFVTVSLVRLVIQLSLNILFIVVLGYGVLGVLYSSLIATLVLSAYLMVGTVKDCGLGFSRGTLKELVIYGYPLIFSHLGTFILTFSDRYFIKAFFDLNEVGLYSFGYKFGILVSSLLMGPFFAHWAVEMFEIDKRADREEVFVRIFDVMFFVSLTFIFAESVFIKEAIKILSAPEYLQAYTVVPVICLAYYFSMLAFYVRLGIMIKKVTKFIAYSTIIAVAVNIGCNFLLIPPFGMYGAAASTLISFYIRFILVYIWSQKVYPLPYRWARLNMLLIYSALLLLVSFLITFDNIVLGVVKDSLFLIVFLVTIYMFWLRSGERELVRQITKNPRQTFRTLLK